MGVIRFSPCLRDKKRYTRTSTRRPIAMNVGGRLSKKEAEKTLSKCASTRSALRKKQRSLAVLAEHMESCLTNFLCYAEMAKKTEEIAEHMEFLCLQIEDCKEMLAKQEKFTDIVKGKHVDFSPENN